jgi:hypothetical protein
LCGSRCWHLGAPARRGAWSRCRTPGVKWVGDALDGRLAADHGHYFCGEPFKAPGTVRDEVEECEAGLGYLDEPLRDRLAATGNRTPLTDDAAGYLSLATGLVRLTHLVRGMCDVAFGHLDGF